MHFCAESRMYSIVHAESTVHGHIKLYNSLI